MKTIAIGAHYRKMENNEKQTLRNDDINRKNTKKNINEQQIVQNALEFADDTQLFIEHDTTEQMNEGIGNYDIVTEKRRLTIQWSKVELLRRGNAN